MSENQDPRKQDDILKPEEQDNQADSPNWGDSGLEGANIGNFAPEAKGSNLISASTIKDNVISVVHNYYYREDVRVTPVQTDAAIAQEKLPCPYLGLFHFSPHDAEFFFGRDIFVKELEEATKSRNFIAVLGASGSGKSSVVLAGLVPKLQQAGHWQFTHFRPGSDPFHAIALALVPLYTPKLDETDQIAQARKLASYLKESSVLLSDVYTTIEQNHPQNRVLLIADQFEELYTLCPDESLRRRFLDCLLASLPTFTSQSSSPLVMVLTMRADFLGSALSYRPFADRLQKPDIKLGAMKRSELLEVIIEPAKNVVTFEAGLVERILDDVENEPGHLPLLEFALTELWEKQTEKQLTHKTYEAIGEVKGALADYADEKYSNLSSVEQEQARKIFIQLVRPGEGTEDTRRLATQEELGAANWSLVQKLADFRLMVTNRNAASQETVEVVHEALIQNWGQLRQWMETDRDFRVWQERFRLSLNQWEETQDKGILLRGKPLAEAQEYLKQRPEEISPSERSFIECSSRHAKRQQTRERIIAGAFSILGLGALSLGSHIYQQGHRLQIEGLLTQAEESFESGEQLDGLIGAIRVARRLEGSIIREDDLSYKTKLKLQDLLLRIREKNRFKSEEITDEDGVQLSPNGKYIIVSNQESFDLIASDNKKIENFIGYRPVFSPDSQYIAFFTKDKKIILWNINSATKQELDNQFCQNPPILTSLHFSPDGTTLACSFYNSGYNTIILYSLKGQKFKDKKPRVINFEKPCFQFNFSPKGTLLYCLYISSLEVRKLTGEKVFFSWDSDSFVSHYSFSADDKLLAFNDSSNKDPIVTVWDLDQRRKLSVKKRSDYVFSPDGKHIVTVDDDSRSRLWELKNKGLQEKDIFGGLNPVFSLDGKTMVSNLNNAIQLYSSSLNNFEQFNAHSTIMKQEKQLSNDGKKLLSKDLSGTFKLWDLKEKALLEIPIDDYKWPKLSFSPDGNTLAFVVDRMIKIWDLKGKEIHKFRVSSNNIDLSFSPDGKTLVGQIGDNQIKWWYLDGKEIGAFQLKNYSNIVFSPDSKILAIQHNKFIKFKTVDRTNLKPLEGINPLFSPDGKYLAYNAIKEDKIIILKTIDGKYREKLKGMEPNFSPDGKYLAYQKDYKTIQLLNLENNNTETIEGYDYVFDSKGKSLAFCPYAERRHSQSTIKIKNLEQQTTYSVKRDFKDFCILTFIEKTNVLEIRNNSEMNLYNLDAQIARLIKINTLFNVSISSPRSNILAYSEGKIINLWDLKSDKIIPLKNTLENIKDINFSPDGKLLASGDMAGNIKIWSIDGQEMITLKAHQNEIKHIKFSPDGKSLMSIDDKGTVIHWNLEIEQLLQKSCDWLQEYLQLSPLASSQDKRVCDGIKSIE